MAIVIVAVALLSGCGGGSGGSTGPTTGPTPVITVAEGHTASAGTTLHLDGTGSIALHPPITEYEWVAVQPAGSQVAFSPSASAGQVTFRPVVPGVYTFYLNVWDSQGGNVEVVPYAVTVN
jgi:hypothetical protein